MNAPTPSTGFRIFEQALAMQRQGRLADAARLYQTVLSRDRDHLGALKLLGVIEAQQGRLDSAAGLFGRAARLDPKAPENHNNFGMALHAQRRYAEAAACFERAIALDPRYAIAKNNLGNALSALGRRDEAIACYREALSIRPDYPEAMNNLGGALHAADRFAEAAAWFGRALAARPDFAEAHTNAGKALCALERHGEALGHFEKAAILRPDSAETEIDLGTALRGLNRHDEAARHYRRAMVIDPKSASPQLGLGLTFQEIGRIGEAQQCFETAVRLEPHNPKAYLCLVGTIKSAAGDPHLTTMEGLARDLESMPETDRIDLHFALGKALADIGEQDRSFRHILAGNALRRSRIAYNEAAVVGRLDRTRAALTAELIRGKAGLGHPSPVPVFIVGMPRSGSTLVEQILASHPQVFAGGERRELRDAVRSSGIDRRELPFPRSAAFLTREQLHDLADTYLTAMRGVAGRPADRITDKLPANFRYAGLIHLALPNARIIHTRRDPIDTCLSCFSTLFETQPFSYELGELGRYYRAYARLMAHWREVLPQDAILDVQYEELVGDFEAQARRIVAYCGLDWDDACLAPHRAERPVKTASVTQVRRPVYRSSVGRWRPAPEVLAPLLRELGEVAGSR